MDTTVEIAWETRPDRTGLARLASLLLAPSDSATPEVPRERPRGREDASRPVETTRGGL